MGCLAADALQAPVADVLPSICLQLLAALLAADPGTGWASEMYAADVPRQLSAWLVAGADKALLAPLATAQVRSGVGVLLNLMPAGLDTRLATHLLRLLHSFGVARLHAFSTARHLQAKAKDKLEARK